MMDTQHEDSASIGARLAEQLLESFRRYHAESSCQTCFVSGAAIYLIAQSLAPSNITDDQLISYLEDLAGAMYETILELRKEADHEGPPKFPDKRTLN